MPPSWGGSLRSGAIAVGIVLPLDPGRFDREIDRVLGGIGRRRRQTPEAEIVVPVLRLDHMELGIELDPHLADVVAEQPADASGEPGVAEIGLGLEQSPGFLDDPIVVRESQVEQGAGDAGQDGGRGL